MERIDIGIIGAGPAGLQAANTISQFGYAPVVFEEHPTIGQPIQCGEGLSIHAFNDFSLPLKNNDFCIREYKRSKLVLPESKVIYGDIHAFSIRRDIFDQFLAKRAADAGAEIKLSTKISDVIKNTDGLKISVAGERKETYLCKLLIIAEGYKADIAKQLGFPPPLPLIKALEYKIKGDWSDDLEFHFDSVKYPFGYSWIFPREDETNVGIVTTAKDRKKRLDSFLKERGITGSVKQKIGGQIPMNGPVKKLYSDNTLLVGDTAGMVNPLFYGGIRLAMTSGQIAGKVASLYLKNLEEGKKLDLKRYKKALQKFDFMKDINLKCHRFFYSSSNNFLVKLATILGDKYINRIEKWEKIKVFGEILKNPSLLKSPRGLYWLYRGFKIARDWGF